MVEPQQIFCALGIEAPGSQPRSTFGSVRAPHRLACATPLSPIWWSARLFLCFGPLPSTRMGGDRLGVQMEPSQSRPASQT